MRSAARAGGSGGLQPLAVTSAGRAHLLVGENGVDRRGQQIGGGLLPRDDLRNTESGGAGGHARLIPPPGNATVV